MSNIRCNTTELLQVLDIMPAEHNIMLVGDLIGLPHKDEATGKTGFMPPCWFPTDGKSVCLFLDELNRRVIEFIRKDTVWLQTA